MNRYGFFILCLPSEAMRPSITFLARTLETHDPSIVLKMHKCLLARDTCLQADSIVVVRTMQREHFDIYASREVNF